MRAAGPAAAVPGARGGVWGKPPPAAGNGGGAGPGPRETVRGGSAVRLWAGPGTRALGCGRAAPCERGWEARRDTQILEPAWGRLPTVLASKHVNKAWCVRVGRVQPSRAVLLVLAEAGD